MLAASFPWLERVYNFNLKAFHGVTESSLSKALELLTSLSFWDMLQEVDLEFRRRPLRPFRREIDLKVDIHLPRGRIEGPQVPNVAELLFSRG